jgi:EAL and modified HD-GYP domain-containing signal transduction protein
VLQLDVATAPFDHDFVEAVRGRIGEGFRFALDNYSYRDELVPMLELAHYLKVDIELLRGAAAASIMQQARNFGVRLIAKNVEAHDDVRFCTETGCDGVQGGFLCQPKIVEARRAPRNIAVLSELLAQLKTPTTTFAEIEEILKKDAGLSATLLRFLNSAGFGLRVQVSTIRQAVALLGFNEFGKWVTLMAMAAGNDKPSELLIMALIRAKTCELVMRSINKSSSGNLAFMAGLFSLLDALLDQPLERVLSELPIADSLRLALLENAGVEGELLAAVLDYERGLLQDDSFIPLSTISDAWCYSVAWVEGMRPTLASCPPS